jgi:hypothetical protein
MGGGDTEGGWDTQQVTAGSLGEEVARVKWEG